MPRIGWSRRLVALWSPYGRRLVALWLAFGWPLVARWVAVGSPFGRRLVAVWSPFGRRLVAVWSPEGGNRTGHARARLAANKRPPKRRAQPVTTWFSHKNKRRTKSDKATHAATDCGQPASFVFVLFFTASSSTPLPDRPTGFVPSFYRVLMSRLAFSVPFFFLRTNSGCCVMKSSTTCAETTRRRGNRKERHQNGWMEEKKKKERKKEKGKKKVRNAVHNRPAAGRITTPTAIGPT